MIIDVIHPGRANVSKSELCDLIAGMYKGDAKSSPCWKNIRRLYLSGNMQGRLSRQKSSKRLSNLATKPVLDVSRNVICLDSPRQKNNSKSNSG